MIRSLLPALLCASIAPAQVVVTGGGAALQTAVDAAVPGDVLIVAGGFYSSLQVDKGITILCSPGVTLTALGPWILRVHDLPADETFVWRGGQIVAAQLTVSVAMFNCAGAVVVESLDATSATGFSITDCTQVALHDVSDSRVSSTNSTVSLVDCECTLNCGTSRISVSGLTMPSVFTGFWDIALSDCESFITDRTPTPHSYLVTGGTLRMDPTALQNATFIGNPPVITQQIPTVTAGPMIPGANFDVSTTIGPGQPGSIVLGLPSPVVTTPIGDYWGGPVLLALAVGTAPFSGELSASVPVPPFLASGERYVVHGAGLDGGLLRLSPALVTVVP